MNAQHTLRIEGVVIVDDGQCDDKARPHVVVRNSNEEWVALCEDEEQADFIVHACNAHDELVAALREIIAINDESAADCRKRMGTRRGNSIVAARVALAKAGAA